MTMKLRKVMINYKGLSHIVTQPSKHGVIWRYMTDQIRYKHVFSWDYVTNQKRFISTIITPEDIAKY